MEEKVIVFSGIEEALAVPRTDLRLFGKRKPSSGSTWGLPSPMAKRRMKRAGAPAGSQQVRPSLEPAARHRYFPWRQARRLNHPCRREQYTSPMKTISAVIKLCSVAVKGFLNWVTTVERLG